MALKFLPLTIRFDYFGSPGTGGTSLLKLRATEDGVKTSNGVPTEGHVSAGQVSSAAGWGGLVTFPALYEACAFYTDGYTRGPHSNSGDRFCRAKRMPPTEKTQDSYPEEHAESGTRHDQGCTI